ncbi:hypothetical protein BDM02DRAFT_1315196 [Thelephora ganbajun]|uniref:Uncharacterized protein n=1 Tax=Thelephora ganbajun TaxID=370292 RepID=A0ACB6Z2P4_THEGA|nr:hypothetical protein BDM02DRAFT_1315196 [Thelephora ganbajun]
MRNRLNNPLPASRKRGWVPSSSEPSHASTNEDFTTGFFDTPKYYNINEMGGVASKPGFIHDGRWSNGMGSGVGDRRKWDDGGEDESENAMEAELPPAKRRKGLAGSIVSTALSAALIGTAVGLTVYRL